MTQLIATSVVRGSNKGESHGGIYLIDLQSGDILQPVDWNSFDIDWQGRGWDRGLRGIAFHDGGIYIAASDEIFVFNQGFELIASYKNQYLKHCHEISIFGDHLFIASTGFDSIIGFNLKSKVFDWALALKKEGAAFSCQRFDPQGDDGPLQLNALHLNTVYCDRGGMFISGLRTEALLNFTGRSVAVFCTLPEGVHNARPFKDGVLFNDTKADAVRFESPKGRVAFRVPRYPDHKLTHRTLDDSRIARQGFGRGLVPLSDTLIAAGSSPSTISIYDLETRKAQKAINLSMDIRNAIHGLEVWPYDWPLK